MVVRDVMVKQVVTVGRKDTVQRAHQLMKEGNFRHLPVVERNRLVGIISDRDLRQVMLSPTLSQLTVGEIMTEDPITVDPQTPVQEAARLLVTHKIGALPVVEEGRALVGVVTETDLLSILAEFLGLLRASARIDVSTGEKGRGLEEISGIIKRQGGEIISVATLPPPVGRAGRSYSFRLEPCDIHAIIQALAGVGYEVLSHAAAPKGS